MIPNIWKNKIHVPNHQPETDQSSKSGCVFIGQPTLSQDTNHPWINLQGRWELTKESTTHIVSTSGVKMQCNDIRKNDGNMMLCISGDLWETLWRMKCPKIQFYSLYHH